MPCRLSISSPITALPERAVFALAGNNPQIFLNPSTHDMQAAG